MSIEVAVRDLATDCDLLKFYFLNSKRYPFLLESVAKSDTNYFDILFAFPGKLIASKTKFLKKFNKIWQQSETPGKYKEEIPFHSGWFINLSYELNLEVEPVLRQNYNKKLKCKSYAVRIPASIVQDKKHKKLYFIAEDKKLLRAMLKDYENLAEIKKKMPGSIIITEEDPAIFKDGIKKIKNYIVEGDVFQVNLSRLWHGKLYAKTNPGQIYNKLRQTNPAPFAGLVDFNGCAIISSSPERLVRLKSKKISTRPIAGTRPRGASNLSDSALSEELLRHPKEQAEHIMLIDLERNDLGRVCKPGTVKVDELMVLESYAHVHHIVSNVSGMVRKGISPVDVIRATFPGGTITGCPKVRCMQIINELEHNPRGAYTGSMGYLDLNGNMDLNILIRSIEQKGRKIEFRAGAGIVHDSVADKELQETRHKAEGMLRVFK